MTTVTFSELQIEFLRNKINAELQEVDNKLDANGGPDDPDNEPLVDAETFLADLRNAMA